MKLRDILEKPIDREINPAVVVSNKKKDTIKAEINEYILTDELIEKLYLLLDTVINKRSGKTGIWINGYYGSGKSHFIKYAHYCINPHTSEDAFAHYLSAVEGYDGSKAGKNDKITVSNITLLKKRIQSIQSDNIMFNVEDETDDNSGERLTRIFLNMFNKFRGYNANDIPLAILLEKYLDRKGKCKEFKEIVETELGYNWDNDAAQAASFELEGVLEIAKRLVAEIDTAALHTKLSNPETFKVGITATLIPELQEYLRGKDENYRLIFLVDEVSQYIGRNKEILLNFQNIIERISQDCNNQVWIACTAQQTLEEVSSGIDGSVNLQDEFGKILGRFDTRISLQSNDASYITQRRVLEKNSTGEEVLGKMYREKKDYIQNQFKIRHELYKGYSQQDDFVLAYPFVPYQFKLIADVFESFQNLRFVIKEVKDNERSVLGITHFTAKVHAELEVGKFMPFDAFFNRQFHTNLTQRGNRAIQNGLSLPYVANNPFAERVVKTLFMISNLPDSTKMTFPSNLDNLTVLMMTELDQNKMKLQQQIKEVLDRLAEESIIREEKGSYFFFNEDEIDVQNIIKNISLNFEDRLSAFDEFFRKMTRISQKYTFGQNDFKMGYAVEDKEFFRGGDFKVTVLLTDQKEINQRALDNNKASLLICINEWFRRDEILRKDFEWFCKTEKFFRNNAEAATGERVRTIENTRIRQNALQNKIEENLKSKYPETRFISGQQVLEASDINGTTPADRFKNTVEKHLERLYKYNKLSESYARNQVELKQSAANTQKLIPQLSPAEERVDEFITNLGNQSNVEDLIKEFAKDPFGWRHEAVLDILVHLVKKRRREFVYRNQPRYSIVDFINKALSSVERSVCEVKSGEEIDQATIDTTIQSFREIFNVDLPHTTDANELFETVKGRLQQQINDYKPYEDEYYGNYPFGNAFQQVREKLSSLNNVRDPKQLFTRLREEQKSTKETFDLAKGMVDFVGRAKKEYDVIRRFHDNNKENFQELSLEAQEKAEKVGQFVKLENPIHDFRPIRKAYEELKGSLENLVANLKQEVSDTYKFVFVELREEATRRGVMEPNVYADEATIVEQISNLGSITQLKLKKSNASTFKREQLTQIIDFASRKSKAAGGNGKSVGEPQEYYITNVKATISTEEELNAYVEKVKIDMLNILKQNKTIIIK